MSASTAGPTAPGESDTASSQARVRRFALIGNPNTGKTTLFNRLCGLRARTANYPGITVDARVGRLGIGADTQVEITDLPGTYALDVDLPEAEFCRAALAGELPNRAAPDALILILDASQLPRNLTLACEALRGARPAVIALNMIDEAKRKALRVNVAALSKELGRPVVAINARTGSGIADLIQAIRDVPEKETHADFATDLDQHATRAAWASVVAKNVTTRDTSVQPRTRLTDTIDRIVVHPVLGIAVFAAVMAGLFSVIFTLAQAPMGWIEFAFETLGSALGNVLPEGLFHDFMVDGVVGGIAGTVVFLPQICLLFFLLTLLEDSGYLARAAFLADGLLRRFGLPGSAFVPLLSSHACALPGIMSARLIPDPRDRIATILVAPFMSCSARLPVYVLLISLLFPNDGWKAGLTFLGCYVLGAIAAIFTALIVRRSILKGRSRPMLIELPSYQRPSLRNALLTTWDRGSLFLRKAGTVILTICIVLWAASAFPRLDETPTEVVALRAEAAQLNDAGQTDLAEERSAEADRREKRAALQHSVAGRVGTTIEPVFQPLGYSWELSIAIVTSFAAREVFVSTLFVTLGLDEEGDVEDRGLVDQVRHAKRENGDPLLPPATAWSLLVFYVLALQCLPTLAVTRREAGGWKWALLQVGYMSAVAYLAGWVTFALVSGA